VPLRGPRADLIVAVSGLDLTRQRSLFEVPDEVAYFNTASLAPPLRSVRAAGEAALARSAAPWKIASRDWFTEVERLRELFARVIGSDSDSVALVPASSYGMAVAAANLDAGPDQRVLVLDEEYPSGIYTWRAFARRTGAELHTVRREQGQDWTDAIQAALDGRAAVVSLPHVHWTSGALIDLPVVADSVHELGAALVIDASQSAGAMPIDVSELRPDFLVCVGYKWLLGPYSLGYLYVDQRYHEGQPLEHNWIARKGAERFDRLVDYTDELQPGARRFDVGERTNFVLTPPAIAALEQVLEWEVAEIAATLAAITAEIENGARERGLPAIGAAQRGPHMIAIELGESDPERVVKGLADRGVHAGLRSSWLRIAPHLHTRPVDVERLFSALDELL
jgi:selenocysteine lyase/cysteine desulfurase